MSEHQTQQVYDEAVLGYMAYLRNVQPEVRNRPAQPLAQSSGNLQNFSGNVQPQIHNRPAAQTVLQSYRPATSQTCFGQQPTIPPPELGRDLQIAFPSRYGSRIGRGRGRSSGRSSAARMVSAESAPPPASIKTVEFNFCLLPESTDTTPEDENNLFRAGLGRRIISIPETACHDEIERALVEEYPQMKYITGDWMLHKSPGGGGVRKLTCVMHTVEGYTGKYLKTNSNNGKIMLYIVPIQNKLDMSPLSLDAHEFRKMPKSICQACGIVIPLQLLGPHRLECVLVPKQGGGATCDLDVEDVEEIPTETQPDDILATFWKICPLCGERFSKYRIESHAADCGDTSLPAQNANGRPHRSPAQSPEQIRDTAENTEHEGPMQQENHGPSQQENHGPSQQENQGPTTQQENQGPTTQQENHGPSQQENQGPTQQENQRPTQQENQGPRQQEQGPSSHQTAAEGWKTATDPKTAAAFYRINRLEMMQDQRPLKASLDADEEENSHTRSIISFYKGVDVDWARPLHCKLHGDDAVGIGVTRHFLSVAMSKVQHGFNFSSGLTAISLLFEGEEDHLIPSTLGVLVDSDLFLVAGRIIGHGFLHDAPQLHGLSNTVVHLILHNDQDTATIELADVPDLEIRAILQKLDGHADLTKEETDEVNTFARESWDLPPLSPTNRGSMFQSLLKREVIWRRQKQIKQLRRGLKDTKVLQLLTARPDIVPLMFPRTADVALSALAILSHVIWPGGAGLADDSEEDDDDVPPPLRERTTGFLRRFIETASPENLRQLVKFWVGWEIPLPGMKVNVWVGQYLKSSTCFQTLAVPGHFKTYEDFCDHVKMCIANHNFYGFV